MKSQNQEQGFCGSLTINGFDPETTECLFSVAIDQIRAGTSQDPETIREFLDSEHGARLGERIALLPGYHSSPASALASCIANGLVDTEMSNYIYTRRKQMPAMPREREGSWFLGLMIAMGSVMTACLAWFIAICFFGFAAIFLMGCGTISVPKTEVVEEAGECGEEVRHCSAEDEDAGDDEDLEDPEPEVIIIEKEAPRPEWVFAPTKRSQAGHVTNAPEGYRLATRAEVIGARESGKTADLMDTDEVVWSSSVAKNSPQMGWLVGPYSDFTASKTLVFPALFVAE